MIDVIYTLTIIIYSTLLIVSLIITSFARTITLDSKIARIGQIYTQDMVGSFLHILTPVLFHSPGV